MDGALNKARYMNDSQDLSLIKVGAHDEIFQRNFSRLLKKQVMMVDVLLVVIQSTGVLPKHLVIPN